ncbi:hypothetical protein GGI15_000473 [Coemansia interrupta]|uniref:Uncharacterized protein n=1 Tax=Coemansia interrupta TaxID=1126814 RepID=A0A9W8HM00_9FUNG|nr:hypothetical protein GGI15_000473 [Coemansia interrupta]
MIRKKLLKPSIEYLPINSYSAKWASVQRRHDASVCICKEVDERLYRLQLLLQRHDEAASAMAREILQLAETKKQLDAIRTQAESIRPVIAMLDDLYAQLAESDTSWSADLVEQESRYRQSRHQHYMQLQQTMDEQYAEMCRESVQMRAENAARSFQRDLDSYVLQQQQQWNADGNRTLLPGAKTGASAGGPSVADVVVTLSGDVEDTFFSDDDDAGHKTSTTNTALKKQQQQQQQVAARNQDGSRSPSPPGIAILQDEDFD